MKRLHLSSTLDAVSQAVRTLSEGGLVVYPTETMYGVAVDASNPAAVARLLKFKNRPAGKPISLLVANQAMAETVANLNDEAKNLYQTFLPGPVTVISAAKPELDSRLASELGTIGIRISSHPIAQELVAAFGKPLTATSANASGKARPYSIETMLSGLSAAQNNLIDLVLDAGELPRNEPSTVIDTTTAVQEVVRAGAGLVDLLPPMTTHSPEATAAYAEKLMESFLHVLREKPVVFALEGEMGAGKTHFTKGIAAALGITVPISSPTYTIQKEYDGDGAHLLHMDCWRLENAKPEDLGLSEYLQAGTVLAIEWAHPLLSYLREQPGIVGYRIVIEHQAGDERLIRVESL